MTENEFYHSVQGFYSDLVRLADQHGLMILTDRLHLIDPVSRRHSTMMISPKPKDGSGGFGG